MPDFPKYLLDHLKKPTPKNEVAAGDSQEPSAHNEETIAENLKKIEIGRVLRALQAYFGDDEITTELLKIYGNNLPPLATQIINNPNDVARAKERNLPLSYTYTGGVTVEDPADRYKSFTYKNPKIDDSAPEARTLKLFYELQRLSDLHPHERPLENACFVLLQRLASKGIEVNTELFRGVRMDNSAKNPTLLNLPPTRE